MPAARRRLVVLIGQPRGDFRTRRPWCDRRMTTAPLVLPDDDMLIARAEARALALLQRAEALTSRTERRRSRRLAALLGDDDARDLLLDLTDQVLRIRDPAGRPAAARPHRRRCPRGPRRHRPARPVAARSGRPRVPVRGGPGRRLAHRPRHRGRDPARRRPRVRRLRHPSPRRRLPAQRERARRVHPRRRRGRAALPHGAGPDHPPRRRLRVGQDLCAVRQPRRPCRGRLARADRRPAPSPLPSRDDQQSRHVRQPRHGGVPRPRALPPQLHGGAGRAGVHRADGRHRPAGVHPRLARGARATVRLGQRPRRPRRRGHQDPAGQGRQPRHGAGRGGAARLAAGSVRQQGRRRRLLQAHARERPAPRTAGCGAHRRRQPQPLRGRLRDDRRRGHRVHGADRPRDARGHGAAPGSRRARDGG